MRTPTEADSIAMLPTDKFICALGLLVCGFGAQSEERPTSFCEHASHLSAKSSIPVDGLYFFGSWQHGAKIVDLNCPKFLLGADIDEFDTDSKKENRVNLFLKTALFTPSLKSGVYRFDGELAIDNQGGSARFLDVVKFEEVDANEAARVMSAVAPQP